MSAYGIGRYRNTRGFYFYVVLIGDNFYLYHINRITAFYYLGRAINTYCSCVERLPCNY